MWSTCSTKFKQAVALSVLTAALCFFAIQFAYSLSFSTDFDGRGIGGSISISKFQPTRPSSGNFGNSYTTYVYENYVEQQKRLDERARIFEELEKARRADNAGKVLDIQNTLDRMDGTNELERHNNTFKIRRELEPIFRQEQAEEQARQRTQLQRLMHAADHIAVPAPPTHYERVFIGGLTYTYDKANADLNLGLADPFTGKKFDMVVGPAVSPSPSIDFPRAMADHFFSESEKLAAETIERMIYLKDKQVDEIVCHSNGCTIARVLILTGFVKGVKTLRVLGGDGAITNLDAYAELTSKGVRIYAYAVVGDQVPLTPTGWEISRLAKKIGSPLEAFRTTASLTYQVLGLKAHNGFHPAEPVHVQLLSAPVKDEPWTKMHEMTTYFGLITGYRMISALDAEGNLKSEAVTISKP